MKITMTNARLVHVAAWTPSDAVQAPVTAGTPLPSAGTVLPLMPAARERGIAYHAPTRQGRTLPVSNAQRFSSDLRNGVPPRSRPA
ncbi:hypothetical protein GCM10010124_07020 [Pilimelia terevasa]|uniref:Uncharacterized protein n=1 Tax=Pilimelia terevasa TaxID=53372 RepID=A0A8J3BF05_9ACTN|nr:hypothetical protein [Pilimelia terevasa]GGK17069.1 hypothetical protein GCM10010124_07020 [Pilimelia terevasa]